MNTELQGRMLLKVVSIIYIVFSGISMAGGLLALLGGGIFLAGGATAGEVVSAGMGGIVILAGIVLIISSALGLVAGILGVKYCNRQDKAQTCFVLGIVLIVFAAFGLIGELGGNGSLIGGLVGLVLPVLYTLGAQKNKISVSSHGGSYDGNYGGDFSGGQNFNTSAPAPGQGQQNMNENIQFPGQGGGSQFPGQGINKPFNGQNGTSQGQQPGADQSASEGTDPNQENKRTVYLGKDQ